MCIFARAHASVCVCERERSFFEREREKDEIVSVVGKNFALMQSDDMLLHCDYM